MVTPALQPNPADPSADPSANPDTQPAADAPASSPSPCHTLTPSPCHPLSPRHTYLLNAYLASNCNLYRFAQTEKLSALDLNEWFTDEAVQEHLSNLRSLAEFGLAMRTTQLRQEALEDLHAIAKTTDDPVEKRRCASAILRGTNLRPVKPPSQDSQADDSQSPSDSPLTDHRSPHTPPELSDYDRYRRGTLGIPDDCPDDALHELTQSIYAPKPDPQLAAEQVAEHIADALRKPLDGQYLVRPFRLLHEKATSNAKPIPRAPYAYLEFWENHLAHEEEIERTQVHYACDERLSPHHSGYRITLFPSSGPSFDYYAKLQRDDYGPHPKCWLITRLDRLKGPPAREPTDPKSASSPPADPPPLTAPPRAAPGQPPDQYEKFASGSVTPDAAPPALPLNAAPVAPITTSP